MRRSNSLRFKKCLIWLGTNMKLSHKQQEELNDLKTYIPNWCKWDVISSDDIKIYFEWSERGLHKDKIKNCTSDYEIINDVWNYKPNRSGLGSLVWAKKWRERQFAIEKEWKERLERETCLHGDSADDIEIMAMYHYTKNNLQKL